ncbi:hypothetical protein NUU61_007986 [Penicillium alfredii]|uniref:Uncharacterized protein n=1 Tax=Penicillium alfredii TaxID=1506179 RepID=A0A9W9ERT9_9EURO|nr:uncharacterized protein NUU61_007986 [Penicillium alfredii]KAJ5086679.1 hypothetical protein NUU61_007986 [Penicillium alfredii]
MAYNAVAQVDEVASDSSHSDTSRNPSPAHGHAFQRLPLDPDHLGGDIESAKTTESPGLGGSMIRSMTASSYDVVEDDDYDVDPSADDRANSLRRIPLLNTAVARHESPQPPLRSASSDVPVPLSHPIPDLQSIQGAYTGNVERLEQSAERLSSSSADIGSEIRRMNQEQKRRSCSSASNSFHVRNGAFSPTGTISSAHGSILSGTRQRSVSGSRLAQLSEPDEHGHVLDRFSDTMPIYFDTYDPHVIAAIDRPSTAASTDTYQQAQTLFTNFDGVHFTPLERADSGRQVSLSRPPLASKPESYKEPQTGESMVYYPAPVPRMLNLPPKLSRKANTGRDKRRTQILDPSLAEKRNSAAWPATSDQEQPGSSQNDKRQSTMPPQLRASVFFDQPTASLDVEIKHDSAVETLESILDASATAPVSAFTDHPYAGHVGSYVYTKSKRRVLSKNPAGHKPGKIGHDRTDSVDSSGDSVRSSHVLRQAEDDPSPVDDDHHERHSDSGSESDETSEEEENEEPDYVGPPNTLLAELQLRKQELKQRRRTALPMPSQAQATHATLLELDAMAQKQSEKRRQRPVTLAWEGRDAVDDDDDIPLAMLYPDKTNADDEDRPLGLMEKRQQEENEPLSARRARLRGEPLPQPQKRPTTMPPTHVPEPVAESGDEIETLAERLKRLRGQDPAESDFAHDLMAEFDSRAGIAPKGNEEVNENETLAQRRNRLQKEGNTRCGNPKNPRVRRSMAALSQGPSTRLARKASHDDVLQHPAMTPPYGNRMSMQQFPPMGQMGYPMPQPYGYGGVYPTAPPYNNPMMAMGGMAYAMPNSCLNTARQPIQQGQRDVIDRWRQSIR